MERRHRRPPPPPPRSGGLSTKAKVLIGVGVYLAIAILLGLIFGSDGKNEAFQPQNEFKLEPWVSIELGGIDLSINKAVFYLLLASALTIAAMTWIARRMAQKPNRVQTAVEVAYDLTKNNITGGNLDSATAIRWFPFLGALFFFIWFSNMIGFLPLPTNTEHTIDIFGVAVPVLRPLRGHRQPLDPAGPDPRRLGLLPRRRDPGQGLLQVPGELAASRARGHEPGSPRASSS